MIKHSLMTWEKHGMKERTLKIRDCSPPWDASKETPGKWQFTSVQ
jgi:hypothetical protein